MLALFMPELNSHIKFKRAYYLFIQNDSVYQWTVQNEFETEFFEYTVEPSSRSIGTISRSEPSESYIVFFLESEDHSLEHKIYLKDLQVTENDKKRTVIITEDNKVEVEQTRVNSETKS